MSGERLSNLFNRWHPGQPSRGAVNTAGEVIASPRPRKEIVAIQGDRGGARERDCARVLLRPDESVVNLRFVVACFS